MLNSKWEDANDQTWCMTLFLCEEGWKERGRVGGRRGCSRKLKAFKVNAQVNVSFDTACSLVFPMWYLVEWQV